MLKQNHVVTLPLFCILTDCQDSLYKILLFDTDVCNAINKIIMEASNTLQFVIQITYMSMHQRKKLQFVFETYFPAQIKHWKSIDHTSNKKFQYQTDCVNYCFHTN